MSSENLAADYGLTQVGALRPRSAKDIASSRIGIGMECLDRYMFKPEKTYAPLEALGAKWARLQTGWSRCERQEGIYDFAWLDEVVDRVIAAGVQPWFNVGYGNRLYSPDAPHESAVGQVPIYDGEKAVKGWQNFLRALGERYRDRVAYWEIWNEPNLDCFWHPRHKPSAEEYTKLVAISSEAIRTTHPKAKIAACVASASCAFIEGCLKAGMGPHIDVFAFHPYRPDLVPELEYPAIVERMRDIVRQLAPHVRLWQGECGAPSQTTGHHDTWMKLWNMNELNQAKWVIRRLMMDLYLDLDLAQYFHLCDLMETPYRQSNGQERPPVMLGILHGKVYTPKTAYTAMQSVCTLFDAETRPFPFYQSDLTPVAAADTALQEPYTLLFRRRGAPVFAYYQATNPQDDIAPVPVSVTLAADNWPRKPDDFLRHPVLVDLITQRVYALPDPERLTAKGQFRSRVRFNRLPCLDYPLLITERELVTE